jgi:hypothetical protein
MFNRPSQGASQSVRPHSATAARVWAGSLIAPLTNLTHSRSSTTRGLAGVR